MAINKIILNGLVQNGIPNAGLSVMYADSSQIVDPQIWDFDVSPYTTTAALISAMEASAVAYAVTHSYPVTSANIVWSSPYPIVPSTLRTTSSLSLSLVGAGATGTQISSTKDSTVRVAVSTSATANISGAAVSTITLKKCATNSATETDWTSVAPAETSQSYSLAVAIQGVTGAKQQLVTDIPSGWYVKLVNTGSGTHSESFISGEKTIYG